MMTGPLWPPGWDSSSEGIDRVRQRIGDIVWLACGHWAERSEIQAGFAEHVAPCRECGQFRPLVFDQTEEAAGD